MNFLEAIRIALLSLWGNKLRSVLTLLGVIIGVAAVIAVVSLIAGIDGYMKGKVFNLGADVFIVNKMSPVITSIDQLMEGQKRKDITMEDYAAIREDCKLCRDVSASIRNNSGKVVFKQQSSTDTLVQGITPDYFVIRDLDITSGRALNDTDLSTATNVAVIGPDVVDNLMAGVDPIGQEIHVDGSVYRVVGVGKARGKALGQSQDNYAMIPITSWQREYGAHQSITIVSKANGVGVQLQQAIDEVRVLLRARRHDAAGQPDSFVAETNENFLSLWASLSSILFTVAVAIPAISLVVGGIVIMNIMLVSVTERTREIGVRKALGAKRADVLMQFLIESATLAMMGGLMGVILGSLGALAISGLIGIPAAVKLWAVLAGMTVATSTGVVFGVYPAWRAANLHPIAALRYEN